MKWPERARLTENDVSGSSWRNREYMDSAIARAMDFLRDPEKKKRLEAQECVFCFYSGGGLAGQAFTEWNCQACLKEQPSWPNTSHPRLCMECAKKHTLCRECGADLHLRVRRNNAVLLGGETSP